MHRLTWLLLMIVSVSTVAAETIEEKGYRIAKAAAQRNDGYGDHIGSGKMVLRNSAGAESVRDFDFKSLEVAGGDKTLLVFNWPGDIRDTALLTHAHAVQDDDQWLYLPATRRVKRISSSGRSGSFVGSEFAYEDMIDQELDKFSYRWVGTERCPSSAALTCEVIDRFPKYDSGYSKQRVWLDTAELRLHQTQYFDRQGAQVKALTARRHQLFQGRFWRAMEMTMRNLRTSKTTVLQWRGFKFGVGLSEGHFTRRALKKLR